MGESWVTKLQNRLNEDLADSSHTAVVKSYSYNEYPHTHPETGKAFTKYGVVAVVEVDGTEYTIDKNSVPFDDPESVFNAVAADVKHKLCHLTMAVTAAS